MAIVTMVTYTIYSDQYPDYPASDHYNSDSRKFYNDTALKKVNTWDRVTSVYQIMFANDKALPEAALPSIAPDWAEFTAPTALSRFIWFGHSSLMMRVGGQTILSDPQFGPSASSFSWLIKRFQPPAATLAELPAVNTVLISHNHYDHLEQASMEHFIPQQTHYIVPLGIGQHLRDWGVPADRIIELDWYQSTMRENVRYTAVPARHTSARSLFNQDKTLWAGWVIEYNGEKIYYSGDTSYGSHFSEIGEYFNGIDIAFIENGQYDLMWSDFHLQPRQTVQAALDLRAKYLIPVHWGMFSLALHEWNDPVRRSVPLALSKKLAVITPKLGQIFDQNSINEEWWRDSAVETTQTEPAK